MIDSQRYAGWPEDSVVSKSRDFEVDILGNHTSKSL